MLISFRLRFILLSDPFSSGFAGQVLCLSCLPIYNRKILHRKDSFEIHQASEFYLLSVVYAKHTPFPLWEIQKCDILAFPLRSYFISFFFFLHYSVWQFLDLRSSVLLS